jgi:hypothetical protein
MYTDQSYDVESVTSTKNKETGDDFRLRYPHYGD